MPRRLLQCLQKCIKCSICNLMRLIQNVNLESVPCWTMPGRLAQLTNFINAAIGGSVDLNHVHRISGSNLRARIANSARFGHRLLRRAAVQSHSQNAGDGRLPNPPVPAKNVTMGNPPLLNGVLERTRSEEHTSELQSH